MFFVEKLQLYDENIAFHQLPYRLRLTANCVFLTLHRPFTAFVFCFILQTTFRVDNEIEFYF